MRASGCRPLEACAGRRGAAFRERMSIYGDREACSHRLFVQARHVFAYCELGRLGWSGAWRPMVGVSIDFLVANGRRADGLYIHRSDPHGRVLDARADLYDQAFMLLALAHAARAWVRRPVRRRGGARRRPRFAMASAPRRLSRGRAICSALRRQRAFPVAS